MTVIYYGTEAITEEELNVSILGYLENNIDAVLDGVTGGRDTKITFRSLLPGPAGATDIVYTFIKSEDDLVVKVGDAIGGIVVGAIAGVTAVAVAGIALIGAPIFLIKFERNNPRTITVTRSRLEATNPSQGGASGKNVAMHKDIESVEVRKRTDIAALGKEPLISSDKGEFRIGKGLSNEALEWMRKLIVSAIAKA